MTDNTGISRHDWDYWYDSTWLTWPTYAFTWWFWSIELYKGSATRLYVQSYSLHLTLKFLLVVFLYFDWIFLNLQYLKNIKLTLISFVSSALNIIPPVDSSFIDSISPSSLQSAQSSLSSQSSSPSLPVFESLNRILKDVSQVFEMSDFPAVGRWNPDGLPMISRDKGSIFKLL